MYKWGYYATYICNINESTVRLLGLGWYTPVAMGTNEEYTYQQMDLSEEEDLDLIEVTNNNCFLEEFEFGWVYSTLYMYDLNFFYKLILDTLSLLFCIFGLGNLGSRLYVLLFTKHYTCIIRDWATSLYYSQVPEMEGFSLHLYHDVFQIVSDVFRTH